MAEQRFVVAERLRSGERTIHVDRLSVFVPVPADFIEGEAAALLDESKAWAWLADELEAGR